MNRNMEKFFRAIEQTLHSNNFRPDGSLKSVLAGPDEKGRPPCLQLYHAWAIAELCCASREWSTSAFDLICFPTGYREPVSDILKDLFYALKHTEIPDTEGIFDQETDRRILLLDTLKRVELAQALRLEVPLYTLDGECL